MTLLVRMDGRIEYICECGVGHTVYSRHNDYTHGCCSVPNHCILTPKIASILGDISEQIMNHDFTHLNKINSKLIRAFYSKIAPIPKSNKVYCLCGEYIGVLNDVIYGDFGPYYEFNEISEHFQPHEFSTKRDNIKYEWYDSKCQFETHGHHQLRTVLYADYKEGKFYLSPFCTKDFYGIRNFILLYPNIRQKKLELKE